LVEETGVKYRVTIEVDEDGKFIASCPSLPGCITEGDTRAEAVANAKEAIEAYLESLVKAGDPVPVPVSEEIIDIDVGTIEGAA
jgi:antitoxin HicB